MTVAYSLVQAVAHGHGRGNNWFGGVFGWVTIILLFLAVFVYTRRRRR